MSVRDAFLRQAKACATMGSPFTARLCTLAEARLVPGSAVADRILEWEGDAGPSADSVPLRLAGALHALRLQDKALQDVYPPADVRDHDLWGAIEAAFADHREEILYWLESPPQTNEVRRSAVLLPVFARLWALYGMALDLSELGASGGLNLRADQYHLALPGGGLGPETSPVQLTPDWEGPLPAGPLPPVRNRAGVDLNPLDPTSEAGRLRLSAYLWADQADRLAHTTAAIDIAAAHPATVTAGDAADWLESALTPRPGHTHLIYHTVAWQYFPAEVQARAEALIRAAGAKATPETPLAWFGMEADGGRGAGLTLRCWPGDHEVAIGRADFHGRWITWVG